MTSSSSAGVVVVCWVGKLLGGVVLVSAGMVRSSPVEVSHLSASQPEKAVISILNDRKADSNFFVEFKEMNDD